MSEKSHLLPAWLLHARNYSKNVNNTCNWRCLNYYVAKSYAKVLFLEISLDRLLWTFSRGEIEIFWAFFIILVWGEPHWANERFIVTFAKYYNIVLSFIQRQSFWLLSCRVTGKGGAHRAPQDHVFGIIASFTSSSLQMFRCFSFENQIRDH